MMKGISQQKKKVVKMTSGDYVDGLLSKVNEVDEGLQLEGD